MKKTFLTQEVKEQKAVLVALFNQDQPPHQTDEYLAELAFLAQTLDIHTRKVFKQGLDKPHPATFVRKGKLEEIKAYVQAEDIDFIIVDEELEATHLRNLEREFKGRMVLDRSLLILEIFKARARTAQAKTQVELAEFQYALPRLTRMWTHLSRQRGGMNTRGGAGEKEIETDRRIIRDRIALLRSKLDKFEQQSDVRRKSRKGEVRVSLVGYTNTGKSTLMRRLSKADVFAENKLFATVDSTVRKIAVENVPFLLSDTVGFIRKLPTTLIECFKSTLAEIVESDILVHVVDVSHDAYQEHIEVVNRTLQEIGAGDKPTIMVFNKTDQYLKKLEGIDPLDYEQIAKHPTLSDLKSWLGRQHEHVVFTSATKKKNLDALRSKLHELVSKVYYTIYPNYIPEGAVNGWLEREIAAAHAAAHATEQSNGNGHANGQHAMDTPVDSQQR